MPEPEETNGIRGSEGVDFGWRVHQAIQDWTRAVDQKAAITLTLAIAISTLAGHEVFNAEGGLHNTTGLKLWFVRVMGVAFAMAIAFAMSVVLPSLRYRSAPRSTTGLIYFGDLRTRECSDIARDLTLLSDQEAINQLSKQLKATATIAWAKHQRLRLALLALAIAVVLFACGRLLL